MTRAGVWLKEESERDNVMPFSHPFEKNSVLGIMRLNDPRKISSLLVGPNFNNIVEFSSCKKGLIGRFTSFEMLELNSLII